MAERKLNRIISHLRRILGKSENQGSTDGVLLRRFVAQGDQGAFVVLVQRHGPLVLGVCRRVLNDPRDAEAAFQATFVVLAREAAALWRRDTLAGWLYRVAYQTACSLRESRVA
jgi:DNA-directed RNA polymerase specialized sigma24 family protein